MKTAPGGKITLQRFRVLSVRFLFFQNASCALAALFGLRTYSAGEEMRARQGSRTGGGSDAHWSMFEGAKHQLDGTTLLVASGTVPVSQLCRSPTRVYVIISSCSVGSSV